MKKLPFLLAIAVLASGVFSAAPVQAAETLSFEVTNITIVPKPPTCYARASKRVITSGDAVIITWKSKGAETMKGLSTATAEWPTRGKQRVAIGVVGKHIFPLTFITKDGGVATCPVKVFVHPKKK
ncbi:hypothetical protein KJ819_03440 [Patescibacteria group bacterium]|nr:hypothetical protein [Patescibacteria group bacterium]MBU1500524.1 hypothetical protein [Patescibacteria group bacterium]MBU2080677.1 hypothetical protein [Patescibacteria group bacterium]MBU2123782.1 hypothetical protein [Patescibacteria group bacterium]MBU2194927.1 hypothetical protein [Patescibacteria group bacterium]